MNSMISEEDKAAFEAYEAERLQESYEKEKQEWIEEHGEDTLDEFEEAFNFSCQMMYQEDDEDFDEFYESFRKNGLSKRSS